MDASAHANGPIQLYPAGHTVQPASTLLHVLCTAMPDPEMKPLLQSITERVDVLARESEFTSEMNAHGLTLLEAQSICAYTCDARSFGCTREDSPFFMYVSKLFWRVLFGSC